jgi:Na+-driven multidrug efflux pump
MNITTVDTTNSLGRVATKTEESENSGGSLQADVPHTTAAAAIDDGAHIITANSNASFDHKDANKLSIQPTNAAIDPGNGRNNNTSIHHHVVVVTSSPTNPPTAPTKTAVDLKTLLYRIAGYSASASVGIILSVSLTIVPLSRVGRVLGTDQLNGASVGLFMLYIFAQYPIMGLGMALDTLCSQEFGRNHTSQIMGIILRRGIVVGQIASMVMSIFLLYIAPYFLEFFYTEEVVMDVGAFHRPAIIYLTLLNFYTCLSKFCFNQLRPMLPIVSMGVGAVIVSPVASYLLVPYGLTATMLGICLAWGVQCLVLLTLVLRDEALRHTFWISCPWWASDVVVSGTVQAASVGRVAVSSGDDEELAEAPTTATKIPSTSAHRHHAIEATSSDFEGIVTATNRNTRNNTVAVSVGNTSTTVTRSSSAGANSYVFTRKGFNEYTSLAIPSMVLIVGEGSAYDLSVLMAAVLGNAAGGTWSATLNYTLWYVAVSGGISSAANVLVGSALGRGDGQLALTYARLVVALSLVASALNSVVIILTLDTMLDSFGLSATSNNLPTLSHQIAFYIKILMPIYHMGECLQVALQGVFGGLGRSDLGAKVLMSTLWIIGVPLSILLGFYVFPQLAERESGSGLWCIVDPDTTLTSTTKLPPISSSDYNASTLCSDQIGVVGIAVGLIVATCVECPCLLYALTTFIDWDKAARLASGEEEGEDEEVET